PDESTARGLLGVQRGPCRRDHVLGGARGSGARGLDRILAHWEPSARCAGRRGHSRAARVSAVAHRGTGEQRLSRWVPPALSLLSILALGCGALPITDREIPGTYVMNLGRAADTLFVDPGGTYRRVYRAPDQPVTIDSGSWT